MVVIIRASRHPCCRIGTTLQERNQTDTSSLSHRFHPAFFLASQVRLSGAEAASHADISSADHLTAPPIRIGAGILPQLLSLKICRLLRLSICPRVLADNNWQFWFVFSLVIFLFLSKKLHICHPLMAKFRYFLQENWNRRKKCWQRLVIKLPQLAQMPAFYAKKARSQVGNKKVKNVTFWQFFSKKAKRNVVL